MNTIRMPALIVLSLLGAGCGDRGQGGDSAQSARTAAVLEPTRSAAATATANSSPEDGVLKTRVAAALRQDSKLNSDSIIVTVREGEVKLDGVVPAEQITRADSVVRKVDGVRVVINALRPVTPSS